MEALMHPVKLTHMISFFFDGTYFNVEIISVFDEKFVNFVDPVIDLFFVQANGMTTPVLSADDDLESLDTWVIDYLIGQTGTYRLQIRAFNASDVGDYAGYIHTGNLPLETGKGKGSSKNGKDSKGRRRLKRSDVRQERQDSKNAPVSKKPTAEESTAQTNTKLKGARESSTS